MWIHLKELNSHQVKMNQAEYFNLSRERECVYQKHKKVESQGPILLVPIRAAARGENMTYEVLVAGVSLLPRWQHQP